MLYSQTDAGRAQWVIRALRQFDYTVRSVVPPVFDAYARVFHPASRNVGDDHVCVRWADVAAANAKVMHPAAEWGSLTGSWTADDEYGFWDYPPSRGKVPRDVALPLAEILAGHTGNPGRCSFAVWDGWGTPQVGFAFPAGTTEHFQRRVRQTAQAEIDTWRNLLERAATFTLPHRPMRLLGGPLAAINGFYEPYREPPALWWPEDDAWCVGTDVDLMTTYVGASSDCITQLIDDQRLEARAVPIEQGITWDADTINPLPAPP